VGRRQRGGRAWQGGEEVEGIEGVSGDWVRARGDRGGPYDGGIGSGRRERGARTGAHATRRRVAKDVVRDQGRIRRRQPRHLSADL
jgi:hypothetical protein